MISKNLTLEVAVDYKRLLTHVSLLDRPAGLAFSIPLQESPAPYQALRTIYDHDTATVVVTNEGLQQIASLIEQLHHLVSPPSLTVTETELKEILFDQAYASSFAHGTSGHLERTVIAKLLGYILYLGGDVVGPISQNGGTDLADNMVSPA
jgi:hypothetical protein